MATRLEFSIKLQTVKELAYNFLYTTSHYSLSRLFHQAADSQRTSIQLPVHSISLFTITNHRSIVYLSYVCCYEINACGRSHHAEDCGSSFSTCKQGAQKLSVLEYQHFTVWDCRLSIVGCIQGDCRLYRGCWLFFTRVVVASMIFLLCLLTHHQRL